MKECSNDFIPPLDEKVNLEEYSKKLFEKAITFEAWEARHLVGLVAAYFNDPEKNSGYITSVSTNNKYSGEGVAKLLLKRCIDYAGEKNFKEIKLEVSGKNDKAIQLYKKFDFAVIETRNDSLIMKRDI